MLKGILFYAIGLLLATGIGFRSRAQAVQPVKVQIELADGQRIEGEMILGKIPVILSVFVSDDDSIAVPAKIINNITFMRQESPSRKTIQYFNQTFVGLMSGRPNPQTSYRSEITAEMINGIRFNTWLWTGAGIAFDQYPEVKVMPLFLSLRGDMLKKPFTPFYFLDAGTGPSWIGEDQFSEDAESDAGWVFHLGGGLKFYADSKINIMLAFGYKNQEVKFSQMLWNGQEEVSNRNYKNFSFRIGIGF